MLPEYICNPVEPEDNYGIGVSTIWASDLGCYETALIDKNGVYPVQRYKSKEEAALGHWEWIGRSKEVESVIQIGHDKYGVPDITIMLERKVTIQ
jgi:hypothetical protein